MSTTTVRGAGFFRRHRTGIASTVVIALAAASIVVYALTTHGNPSNAAHLNDSGVWVTTNGTTVSPDQASSGCTSCFGELDVPAGLLSAVIAPSTAGTQVDILQDGNAVAGYEQSGTLTPLDPITQSLDTADAVDLGNTTPSIGGDANQRGTLASYDKSTGKVWASTFNVDDPLGAISSLDQQGKAKAAGNVGANGAVAVGSNGDVYGATATSLTSLTVNSQGKWTPTVTKLPAGLAGAVQVTSVGSDPVVLSQVAGSDAAALVLSSGKVVQLKNAARATLQQPGPTSTDDTVLVATAASLLTVSLASGDQHVLYTAEQPATPAQPVYFESCAFGAWDQATPVEVRDCLGALALPPIPSAAGTPNRDLVFRVNHGNVLLNDAQTGEVWNAQSSKPQQLANWADAQVKKLASEKTQTQNTGDDKTKAPVANPDALGARPGQITALHVLDNDKTAPGTVLTVNSIEDWDSSSVAPPTISPDKQSVLVSLPSGASGEYTFDYDASNGAQKASNKAKVTVTVVPSGTFVAPQLRTGFTPTVWHVPVNGVLTIPVLNDWRDYGTGDPPSLGIVSVSAPGASAITTPDGSIVYSASNTAGTDKITYTVLDGDKTSTDVLSVVVDSQTARAVAPVAENDFVDVVVGQPLPVYPLANDLPGSDPNTHTATLAIAGSIKGKSGLAVAPPDADGAVVLTASKAGTYELSYQDTFGSAPASKPAVIRVEADAPNAHESVVGEPDTVTVRGTAPALLDPTANDYSPTGALLTVVGVGPASASNLAVAVVQGRWLRINQLLPPAQGETPRIETFDYTLSDGATSATTQVTVVEQPRLLDDDPVTVTDYATVRAGDSVTVPVLDNDIDPSGDQLVLAPDVAVGQTPGTVPVTTGGTPGQLPGAAYLSGNEVRYVAPAGSAVKQQQQVSVTYTAENSQQQKVAGTLIVTITPPLAPANIRDDQAPVPPDLEARVVAGGTITIPVPTSDIDPDGDSVQVQGLALPENADPQPKFGAVIAYTANSLTYQAYPSATNHGTDTFVYQVTDTYGATARATVRVAVVQPTVLPPPVAHDFTLTAAPNTKVRVHVVSPQYVDYPDGAAPTLLDPSKLVPDGKSIGALDPKNAGWLIINVPAKTTGQAPSMEYEVQPDLGVPSHGEITLNIVPGYKAAPIAVDEFAKPTPKATSVQVNLLAGDYSPTGGSLSIVPQRFVSGRTLTVPLTGEPQVVPFLVRDSNGAEAAGIAYIPATGANSVPYWNGKTIPVPESKATTIDISQYVTDPQGLPLQLTEANKVWTSPAIGLTQKLISTTKIELTGVGTYQGPASVTFAVTRTDNLNDYTLVTVPVIVGKPTPVLRCPTDIVDVEQGLVNGSLISPVAQCHVWTPPSVTPASLTFRLSWKTAPGLVNFAINNANQDKLQADHNAKPGSHGVLTIAINGFGSTPANLNVQVVPAPALAVSPISVKGILTTGKPTVINLGSYVVTPFATTDVSIAQFQPPANVKVLKSPDRRTLTITTSDATLHGGFVLPYVVTDISNPSLCTTNPQDVDRCKAGQISLQFIGVPGTPTAVTPRPGYLAKEVPVSWTAPPNNGMSIDQYQVRYSSPTASAGVQTCAASGCAITGLTNGSRYTFEVRAHNYDWGAWSSPSGIGIPDQKPATVEGFTAVVPPGDQKIVLTWDADRSAASSVGFNYFVSWTGHSTPVQVPGGRSATTYTATGLDNDQVTTFTIYGSNEVGPGEQSQVTGESAGKPTPPVMANQFTPSVDGNGDPTVDITWNKPSDVNGPAFSKDSQFTYDLHRSGGTAPDASDHIVCTGVSTLDCSDGGDKKDMSFDGTLYYYWVVAHNKYVASDDSNKAELEASTPPAKLGVDSSVVTSTPDGEAQVQFTPVVSNGKSRTISCTVSSGGRCDAFQNENCSGAADLSSYPVGEQASVWVCNLPTSQLITFTLTENNGSTLNNGDGPPATTSVTTNGPPTVGSVSCANPSGTTVTCSYSAQFAQHRGFASATCSSGSGNCSANDGTVTITSLPHDGSGRSVTVNVTDTGGDTASASGGYTDPTDPEFVITHDTTTKCTYGTPACELVYVQIINFAPGASASCSAAGAGGAKSWSATLVAQSDGTSAPTNGGSPGPLFDTQGHRFPDGTYQLGDTSSGLTCTAN